MDYFTRVLIIASIVYLGLYYLYQYRKFLKEQEKLTWPRNISPCPDYWVHEGNNVCKNTFNIGRCPNKNGERVPQGTVDFNSQIYKNDDGNVQKCRWAKRCLSSWEGIDNLCA